MSIREIFQKWLAKRRLYKAREGFMCGMEWAFDALDWGNYSVGALEQFVEFSATLSTDDPYLRGYDAGVLAACHRFRAERPWMTA